ncbi:MAG: flagellar hook-length control protein FliK [Rhodobacteraceae bacterium]|nr:flagellar hook-length control protein FliK [Paracoccaceae bacterium]
MQTVQLSDGPVSNLLTAAAPKNASPTSRQGEEFDVHFEQAGESGAVEPDIPTDRVLEVLLDGADPDDGSQQQIIGPSDGSVENPHQVVGEISLKPFSTDVGSETGNSENKLFATSRPPETSDLLGQQPVLPRQLSSQAALTLNNPLLPGQASELPTDRPRSGSFDPRATRVPNPLFAGDHDAPKMGELTDKPSRNDLVPSTPKEQNTVPGNLTYQIPKNGIYGEKPPIESVKDGISRPAPDGVPLTPGIAASETSKQSVIFGNSVFGSRDSYTPVDGFSTSRSGRSIPGDIAQINDAATAPSTKAPLQTAAQMKAVQAQTLSAAIMRPMAEQNILVSESMPSELFVTPLSEPGLQTGNLRAAETMLARPETARMVASQMAEAVMRTQNNKIEIALNPEELGRVRMVLSTTELGVTVSIVAERVETLDLMRRHIDQLAKEFRELGYQNIGFEFSGGESSHGSDGDSTDVETKLPTSPDDQRDAVGSIQIETARASQPSGLDLRL